MTPQETTTTPSASAALCYGSFSQFRQLFAPSRQAAYTTDADRCHFGTAPTLAQLAGAYGPEAAAEWLAEQFADLSAFSGAASASASQVKQLATLVAREYAHLKVSEVMLFLRRFKLGDYGRFYGTVDPIALSMALKRFSQQRDVAHCRHDAALQALRRAELERLDPPITREEYERRKALRQAAAAPCAPTPPAP